MIEHLMIMTILVVSLTAGKINVDAGNQILSTPYESGLQQSRPMINRSLTIQETVAIALKESPVVRGAEEEVNIAIARVAQAKAATRPTLSATSFLTAGSEENIYVTPSPLMPQNITAVPRSFFFNQNAMFMFPVYTGGRLKALIRQARSARQASDADLQAVHRGLALEVKSAYRQTLLREATVEVFRKLTDTAQERLRIDRDALEQGRIPGLNVLRDEAELANAQQQLVDALRDVDMSYVMLKTVMGINQSSQITLAERLTYEPSSMKHEELLPLAERQRPELQAARRRVDAARLGTSAVKGSYKPQVSLAAMGDFMAPRGISSAAGASVGLVLGVPILTGGMRRAEIGEAKAEERKAQQEYEKVALQVVQEVEQSYLTLLAAEKNIRAAESAITAAEEAYRVTQIRYTEGRGINVEVLDALTALTRARTNQIQALFEYNVARDQLLRAIGQQ